MISLTRPSNLGLVSSFLGRAARLRARAASRRLAPGRGLRPPPHRRGPARRDGARVAAGTGGGARDRGEAAGGLRTQMNNH